MGKSVNDDVVDATRRFVRSADIQQARVAARYSLVTSDVTAMGFIMEAASLSPSQLADRLGLAPSTTTKLIDRLKSAGLVFRQANPHDLRRAKLFLSEEGVRIYTEAALVLINAVDAALAGMSDRDGRAVVKFLQSMAETSV